MSAELESVRAYVNDRYEGEYITRYNGRDFDGGANYVTVLHGPDGPAVHVRIDPDGSWEHEYRP